MYTYEEVKEIREEVAEYNYDKGFKNGLFFGLNCVVIVVIIILIVIL